MVWCTFGEEQIDLNVPAPAVKKFIRDTLADLARRGASAIRLDAFAYAVKKPGTSCFFRKSIPTTPGSLRWQSVVSGFMILLYRF